MEAMKALTLTQPYATLVALGAKRIETRSWRTHYSGPLAIHAAVSLGPIGGMHGLWEVCSREPFESVLRAAGFRNIAELPRGAIVAVCDLISVVSTTQALEGIHWTGTDGTIYDEHVADQERAFGDYTPGRYAWLLANMRELPAPIPSRGALGLWDVPAAIATQIRQMLDQ